MQVEEDTYLWKTSLAHLAYLLQMRSYGLKKDLFLSTGRKLLNAWDEVLHLFLLWTEEVRRGTLIFLENVIYIKGATCFVIVLAVSFSATQSFMTVLETFLQSDVDRSFIQQSLICSQYTLGFKMCVCTCARTHAHTHSHSHMHTHRKRERLIAVLSAETTQKALCWTVRRYYKMSRQVFNGAWLVWQALYACLLSKFVSSCFWERGGEQAVCWHWCTYYAKDLIFF